jgi:competence protein ComEC
VVDWVGAEVVAMVAVGGTQAGAGARPSLATAIVRNLEAEQDRWFLWLPVVFGGGIALYFMLPAEPWRLAATLPALAALAVHLVAPRGGVAVLATAALLAVAAGVAAGRLRTEAVRAPVLHQQKGPIDVYGFIELIEPRAGRGQRLTIRVTALEKHEAGEWPHRVRVRTMTETPALQPGDAVRLKATLSPPPGPALPGDFDFARTAWFQSLGAVGFATAPPEVVASTVEPPLTLRISAAVARLRQAIGRRVVETLPGQTGAIANALITGERGGISEGTNQLFRDSGLFHILSISGLHMVIMAGAVFFSIRFALAAIPAVALRYPIKKWAAGGAMAGALAYLMISGAAFATVRSYIMISIMFLAVMLDRPAVALRNVALAALAILLVWPESLLDAGFQMSFAAVVALVSAYEWVRSREERGDGPITRGPIGHAARFLAGIVTSTLIAGLAVAPFGVYHFHNTQQFAILANLIAIPICNVIVMPAALVTLVAMPFGLEAAPLAVMGWGIEAMTRCAQWVAALPGAVGRVPAVPTYAFVLVVVGGLWCALWSRRWRWLGVMPIVLGLILAPTGRRPDVLVGRGGNTIAVRAHDGTLSALAGRGSNFELARWLEYDGDARPPSEAAKAQAFRCDAMGCTARVKGLLVTVSGSPAALRDDCAMADLLILRQAKPRGCSPRRAVIDVDALTAEGAHAAYVDDGSLIIETVAERRGDRPWAPHARRGAAHNPRSADPLEENAPVRGRR